MPTNPDRPRKRGQRPYVDLDPADSLLIRQTYEKLQVIFITLKNLQVEVSQLRASNAKTLRALRAALDLSPQDRGYREAIIKEFGTSDNSQVKDHAT